MTCLNQLLSDLYEFCLIYTSDWQIFTCAFVGFGVNFDS